MSRLRIVACAGTVAIAASLNGCGDGDGPTAPATATGSNRRLSVGEETVCALDGGGALYCWGLNSTRFEYGVSPTMQGPSPAPVKLSAPTFESLAPGPSQHMCGITSNHLAYCW